jgi:hypothetical protein
VDGPTVDGRDADLVDRWVERPLLASVIRVVVLVVPIAAGFVAGLSAARWLPRLGGWANLGWVLGILAVSTVTVSVVDRFARKLLPLATLLRLSLVFPDRVPSRFKLARQAGNVRVLERRIAEARERGLDDDPARAAEQILTLVAALSAHDRKTRGHSERVRAFTDMLAEEFGLSQADSDRLRWAALLHDTGKLEVPSATLNKPGKPNEAEWARLRQHPIEGERIAAPLLPWLGPWAAVIGQHHERWDGAGYPRGVSGEDISLGARIVSLADSFEVMTAARSYKRPMTPTAARRELQRCAGGQFDPAIVRAFLNISLGRLWWAVGPASWVAQVPFILRIGQTGEQAFGLARAATAVAVNGLAGILALGVGATSLPPSSQGQRVAAVVPAATSTAPALSNVSVDPPGPTDDGPAEDPETEAPAGEDRPADEADPADEGSSPAPEDPGDDPTDDGGRREAPAAEREPDRDEPGAAERDGTVDRVVDAVDRVVDDVTEVVRDVGGVVEDVTDVVDDVVEDVTEAVGGVVDEVTGTVDDVVGGTIGGLLR